MTSQHRYAFPGHVHLGPQQGPGCFIVFCGTDGAGKSTLLTSVKTYLERKEEALEVKFPSAFIHDFAPYSDYRRNVNRDSYSYRAVSMAVMADRVQVVEKMVRPALLRGEVVISHRYVYAGLVRLHMHGDASERWFHESCTHLIKPHLVFLVVADNDKIRHRLQDRRFESNSEFQIAEACEFQALLLTLAPANDFIVIDTTRSTIDECAATVTQHIQAHLLKMPTGRRDP